MKSALKHIAVLACLLLSAAVLAQPYTVKGTVTDKATGEPVEFATVVLEASEQWAVADAQGRFSIPGVKVPKTVITASCLGYVSYSIEITVSKDIDNLRIRMDQDNLALEKAVVTAKENESAATTSRTIDKAALEHMQVMNVTDISSLLPGGATSSAVLTSEQQFNIRAGTGESGNSSFGTAVEVDGVRLSNNATYVDFKSNGVKGVSTNNIASANVESVEVISGVPSVEYGDMSSGVVKINTKKGKTPWSVTMSTSPRTKQVSVSKGFGLGQTGSGASRGVLNTSLEYTRSISEQMSPYTSYLRRQLSLTYSNTISSGIFQSKPLRLTAGVTGNLGGLDNSADPDKFSETFVRQRDNAIRANFNAGWLLSLDWITNIEFSASAALSDKQSRENKLYHESVAMTAMHAREEGYYMSEPYSAGDANNAVMVAPGSWYNTMCVDDRPLTTKMTLKANWAHNFGAVSNKVKAGADWSHDRNLGVGLYSEDFPTAPSYREYRYCDNPSMNNIGIYLEDNLMIPAGQGRINLIAGLREDITSVAGSAYGTTSSLSPRFNAKYTVLDPKLNRDKFMRELSFRGSWGVAVKQPSFSILYPVPSYLDVNTFVSTASADNTVYRAYYVRPHTIEYNPNLRWQKNHQAEFGIDTDLAGNKISLVAYYTKSMDTYKLMTGYERLSYAFTNVADVQGLPIPAGDRIYRLDPATGVVTVSDRTGAQPALEVNHSVRKQFISTSTEVNQNSPLNRFGLEWVVVFKEIRPIHTTIRVDGNFYSYRSYNTDIEAYCPSTTAGSDGQPFKYIGYYFGGNSIANGKESRSINNNITLTTHIPKVRMIITMKLETSLLNYSRSLSERPDGQRSYALDNRAEFLSFDENNSIYGDECYTVMFPDYYVSFDNPEPVPFLEKIRWAKTNDPDLYQDLSKLVVTSNYLYYFNKDYISPYFSANFSVTKEIGDIASVSFYANNFFNNIGQVYSTRTNTYASLYRFIPRFYYGLTIRLKF
ncbi:MAG: TonB-dependent receptor [Bacteroidales bacterium]|nr:TonB-dependent receptor [Bacteroidales bacterium]